MATNENLPPNVIKQLVKELKNLDEAPPEGIKVLVNDDEFSTIFADIEGPAGTPYENGIFRLKLFLSHDFPQSPPKGFFLTKIFHPNIATNGEICVNTLKKDWDPCVGLRHVLLVIRCLLIEPFPESALNEQAGKMLLENYEDYARHARLYTGIHALKPKPKPKTLTISESTTALNVDHEPLGCCAGTPLLPPNALATASPSRAVPDHSAASANPPTATELTVGAAVGPANVDPATGSAGHAAAQKKGGAVTAKIQTDKKKMDARKRSLKRL